LTSSATAAAGAAFVVLIAGSKGRTPMGGGGFGIAKSLF